MQTSRPVLPGLLDFQAGWIPSCGKWIDLRATQLAEEQIVRPLGQREASATTVEVCRAGKLLLDALNGRCTTACYSPLVLARRNWSSEKDGWLR